MSVMYRLKKFYKIPERGSGIFNFGGFLNLAKSNFEVSGRKEMENEAKKARNFSKKS